jgi:hypothetical protein
MKGLSWLILADLDPDVLACRWCERWLVDDWGQTANGGWFLIWAGDKTFSGDALQVYGTSFAEAAANAAKRIPFHLNFRPIGWGPDFPPPGPVRNS